MIAVWVIVAILVIAVMILTHELGHFLAAKAVGIKAEQFSLGFGPEIVGWDRGETRYSIKWLLAGGSVKILGMNPEEEIPEEDRPRAYTSAPYWKRAVVILAGSFVHVLIAIFLFYLFFWPIGYRVQTGKIAQAEKTIEISAGHKVAGPAYEAGLRKGDLITEVNGVKVHEWADLTRELSKRPGQVVDLLVRRDGRRLELKVRLLKADDGRGILGIKVDVNDTFVRRSNPIKAAWQALKTTGEVTVLLVKGLGSLFSMKTLKMLVGVAPRTQEGPRSIVGAAQLTFQAAGQGASIFIFILAQIFLFLAIFNLIPLPPFDGGHLLVIIIEKLTGREIDFRKLLPVAWAVIVLLSVVALRLALLDIFNPLKNPFKP